MTTHVARPLLQLPAAPLKKKATGYCATRSGRWLREGLSHSALAFARSALQEAAVSATLAAPASGFETLLLHPCAVHLHQLQPSCTPTSSLASSSDPALLALIPGHVRADVFAAYCTWLCDARSAGGMQFAELLKVCPQLDVAIYRHALRAVPHWAGGKFQQWCGVVQCAVRDAAVGDKLVQALMAAIPCPARRRLHF